MKNIAVFFGGTSVERDVSVITGVLTLNSLDKSAYNPVPVYISGNGEWYTGESLFDIEFYKSVALKKLTPVTIVGGRNSLYKIKGRRTVFLCTVSVAINCLHGERGEDGCLAGVTELCGIPLASPSIIPASVSMDKDITKIFMKGLGIKTLRRVVVEDATDIDKKTVKIGYPLIVKPARLGSSIGISEAGNLDELKLAVSNALRYGKRAIIEKCLVGFTEINCAVYRCEDGNLKISECERPLGVKEILGFDDKYKNGEREFPAKIDETVSAKIKKITAKVYDALDFDGIIRIDYMISDGEIYLNEINSVPGSLAYYLFGDTLKNFSAILTDVIKAAERKFALKSTFRTEYDSAILDIEGCKGGKRR